MHGRGRLHVGGTISNAALLIKTHDHDSPPGNDRLGQR